MDIFGFEITIEGILNTILIALVFALVVPVFLLAQGREKLIEYRNESDEARYEAHVDKYYGLIAGIIGFVATVVILLEFEIGWFFVFVALALLAAGAAVLYRLGRQRSALLECKHQRAERVKLNQPAP